MSFFSRVSSVLQGRLNVSRPESSTQGKTRPRHRPGRSLRLEPLEDRSLLSVFTVANLGDGAVSHAGDLAGSLRQAIYDANNNPGDDTIEFDASLADQTITLTQGSLAVTDTTGKTTINGLGANHLTISGNNASCVLYVGSGVTADVTGVTITKGAYSSGGGIINNGTLTISDSTISGNKATSEYGGGIYTNGSVTMTGCTVSGNTASQFGGGIYVYTTGSLTISNSTVSGNTATSNSGGGIANGGNLSVTGSTISGNTTGYCGGGLYLYQDSTTTLSDTTISSNSAASYHGGGVFVYQGGNVTITGGSISGNSATWGGGIFNDGELTAASVLFANNTASNAGGGLYNYKDATATIGCTVSANTATDGGGASNDGTLTIVNSTFSKNSATTYNGGGVSNSGMLTVISSTFVENTAAANGGGGIANFSKATITNATVTKNSAKGGGGFFNNGGTMTIADSTIAANAATTECGGVFNYVASGSTSSGTIAMANTIVADNTSASSTSIDVCGTVTANYCLIEKTAGATFSSSSGHNITGVDPSLGTLGDYGGSTQTIPLQSGSAALNAGSNAIIPSNVGCDQRGFARIAGGTVDIGAYEYNVPVVTLTADVKTNNPTPTATVTVADEENNVPAGTTVSIDVDLNHNGTFTDAGEKGYATGVLDASGSATIVLSPALADGTYSLRARVSDAAGHEGTSDTATIAIDATGPTVTLGSPSVSMTAGGPVTYAVTYADAHFDASTLTVSDISLITTGTATGTIGLSGSGSSYVVTISGISGDGTLAIALAAGTASDQFGNLAKAATSAAFAVDNTAPTVAINQAASQTDPTDSSTIHFTVVFSEAVAGFGGSGVALAGSTAPGALTAKVTGSGTTYDVAVSGMTGNGDITAGIVAGAAHDAAGNGNGPSSSADATVSFTGGPIVSNVAASPATSAGKSTIIFNVTASGGIKSVKMTIDGKSVSVRKKSGGAVSATYAFSGVLSAGPHSFEIVATNAKGSTRYSGGLTVAPTVPTISKVKTKATTSDKAATIAWNVADIDGIASVALSIDGGEPIAMSQKAGAKSSNYSYSAKLTAGTHSYTITALDSAGAAAASCTGTLTVKGTVPAIKNVKVTAKTSGDTTTITWTVFDIDGIGSTTLKIDGSAVAAGIAQVANADGSVTYTYKGLQSAGKHTFTVGAIDAAPSPVSAKQAKGSFTVKPTAPTVSNIVTAGTTDDAAIAWTVYDVDGIGSVSLTIDGKAVNSSLITVSVKSNAEASYSYAGSLAAGEHTYLITVTDAKKVSGKATAKFTVTTAPTEIGVIATATVTVPPNTVEIGCWTTVETGCWTTGSISFLDTVSVFVPEATVIDQE